MVKFKKKKNLFHTWSIVTYYLKKKDVFPKLLIIPDVCLLWSPSLTLDDQTQVDSKPTDQPEHASLNQCQLTAANRPKLVIWAPPAGGGDI